MRTKEVKFIYGDGQEKTKVRLYADEGRVLTNDGGYTYWNCIDVDSTAGWEEIDAPIEDGDEDAEIEDYERAMQEAGM